MYLFVSMSKNTNMFLCISCIFIVLLIMRKQLASNNYNLKQRLIRQAGHVYLLSHTQRGLTTTNEHLIDNATHLNVSFHDHTARYHAQMRNVFSFIEKGRCKHLYLDFGSNIGVQIRKLYQPKQFPGSPGLIFCMYFNFYPCSFYITNLLMALVFPFFNKMFLNASTPNSTFGGVCAIGFEPNSAHTEYLQKGIILVDLSFIINTNNVVSTNYSQHVFPRGEFSCDYFYQHCDIQRDKTVDLLSR